MISNEIRAALAPLAKPRVAIYWADLSLASVTAWASFSGTLFFSGWSTAYCFSFLICALASYRAVLFIHEIIHFKRLNRISLFWIVSWGFVSGFLPYLYRRVHAQHHRASLYGGDFDGEYVDFALSSRKIIFFIGEASVSHLLLVFRAAILTPLSMVFPSLRNWVMTRASSAVINPGYRAVAPQLSIGEQAQEIGSCLFWWALIGAGLTGRLPVEFYKNLFGIFFFVYLINAFRTLVAHRFRYSNAPQDLHLQVSDSINLVGDFPWSVINELLAPVGLRYHALHHYLPWIPYHSLSRAHKILMAQLPRDSFYRSVNERNALVAAGRLFVNGLKRG